MELLQGCKPLVLAEYIVWCHRSSCALQKATLIVAGWAQIFLTTFGVSLTAPSCDACRDGLPRAALPNRLSHSLALGHDTSHPAAYGSVVIVRQLQAVRVHRSSALGSVTYRSPSLKSCCNV